MKKMWKHEWKYHLFFVILLLLFLLVDFHSHVRNWMYFSFVDVGNMEERQILWEVLWVFGGMEYQFMERVVIMVLAVILIKKGFIYYIEKNAYGRDFFQSLPIRKNERFCFHLQMDVLTVVLAIVAMGIYEPLVLQNLFLQQSIEIPWLSASYANMIVVNISYALMLLGVLYIVENLFVNGVMKVVGFLGFWYITTYLLDFIFNKYESNIVVEKIYGFLSRASVGGNYYSLVSASYNYGILNEPGENVYYVWMHEQLNPVFLLRGEQLDYSLISKNPEELQELMTSLNQLYDFTHISSFIWYAVGYLVIAFVLIMLAKHLANLREASKEEFYFGFVKYVVSGYLSVAFYVLLITNQVSGWHHVLCILSAILMFILLVCLLDVERFKSIRQRIKGIQVNS